MSSEWSGPAPVAQQYPANEPSSVRRLLDMIADVKREAREATSNLLSTAGIVVTRAGMRIASSLTVEGDLASTGSADISGTTNIGGTTHIGGTTTIDGATTIDDTLHITGSTDIDGTLNVDAATTIGGTLGVTGPTTLGGDTDVTGTLDVTGATSLGGDTDVTGSLDVTGPMTAGGTLNVTGDAVFSGDLAVPNGSITNAALANPVITESDSDSVAGLGFPATEGTVFTGAVLALPAGFVRATVMVIATGRCTNTGAGAAYFGLRPRVDASSGAWATGATQQVLLATGAQGTVSSPLVYSFDLTGYTSPTLTFSVLGWASGGIAGSAGNFAGYSWIALLTR